MKPHIIFKTQVFPTVSETFVTNSIVEAIKNGCQATIIPTKIAAVSTSSQAALIAKFDLMNLVSSYQVSKVKAKRWFIAGVYLLHPTLLTYFIKYCRQQQKVTLDYLFQLKFYLKFRKARAFHIHFGTLLTPQFRQLVTLGYIHSKIIVTYHGYDAYYLKNDASLLDFIATYVDHITVNSSYLKDVLLKKNISEKKIHIVPIGIDTAFFNLDVKPITPKTNSVLKIISVGRLIELKGHHLGIQVIKKLKDKGVSVQYTIVGDGERKLFLQRLIKKLELENDVLLVGSKNQDQIKELLKEHHLFLMTSTADEEGRREAFGVVSLEAQAMGLPVVGFHSGGVIDTIVQYKTGILVEENNIEALVEAIFSVLAQSTYEVMSAAAIAHIKANFSVVQTTKKYLELY